MIPRQRDEGPAAYIRRALIAHTDVSTRDLAQAATPDGVPVPVTPVEAAKVVASLRQKDWRIDTVARDSAGWMTYHLREVPKKKEKDPYGAFGEAREAGEWACTECGTRPTAIPKSLLGGLGEGRCNECKKKVLFKHR